MEPVVMIIIGVIALIIILILGTWILRKMKGKVTVNIQQYDFNEGEKITGTLDIKLKKPLIAQEILIGILALQKNTSYNNRRRRRSGSFSVLEKPIKSNTNLNAGINSIPFEITIPQGTTAGTTTGNKAVDGAIKGAQLLLTGGMTNIKWYLNGRVKCAGVDLLGKTQITINQKQNTPTMTA